MTNPIVPSTPTKTEFGNGPRQFVHPDSDYQSQRELSAPVEFETLTDQYRKFVGDKRTDPTDPTSGGGDDMIHEFGNPDQFGPGPKLASDEIHRPSGVYPQPVFRTGVDREE